MLNYTYNGVCKVSLSCLSTFRKSGAKHRTQFKIDFNLKLIVILMTNN